MNIKSHEDILKLFAEIEDNFPVDQWMIADRHVWPMIRINLGQRLSSSILAQGKSDQKKNLKAKIFLAKVKFNIVAVVKTAPVILAGIFFKKKYDVIFFDDGLSFSKIGNRTVQNIFDPLFWYLQKYTQKMITISWGYSFPNNTENFLYPLQPQIDFLTLLNLLREKIVKPVSAAIQMDGFDRFCELLREKQLDNFIPELSSLCKSVERYKFLELFYSRKLKKWNPKAVFINCYYGYHAMAMISACRSLKILSFDVQHGVAGDIHFAYSQWKRVPSDGYEYLPDYFLSWQSSDAFAVNRWSKVTSRHKAIFIGNLLFDAFSSNSKLFPSSIRENVLADLDLRSIAGEKPLALVTMGWGVDLIESNLPIWTFFKEFGSKYRLFVRVHPTMRSQISAISERLTKFGVGDFNIQDASQLPLFALLPSVDVHMTNASAVAIDAANFSVPTIVCSRYGAESLAASLPKNLLYFAETSEQIQGVLAKGIFRRNSLRQDQNQELERKENLDRVVNLLGLDDANA